MLKKETLAKIAGLLKIKESDLTEAITATEEKDITIPEVVALTTEELSQRDKNKKDEGVLLGKDLQIKEIKKAAALDYEGEGSLSVDRLVKELTAKAEKDAKIEPDKKVSQLTEQVTLLQKQLGEKDGAIKEAVRKAQEASFNANLLSWMPANRRTEVMTDEEYATLVRTNLEFEMGEDGKVTGVKKGGQLLRDSATQNPIDPKAAISQFFTERKWIAEAAGVDGRGGGSSGAGGGKPQKYSEVEAQWVKEGKNVASAEFQAHLAGLKKENPNFDLSN